jgi:two-component system, OmpR family, sensor kinase
MTWSIRARLTAWYGLLLVVVLVAGAVAVVVVQDRLALERLDGELERLMLTLEGVMRTEFGEGLTLQGAADEASAEVVAPDRTLVLTEPDGDLLQIWGRPLGAAWRPRIDAEALETVTVGPLRLRAFSHPINHNGHRYVAAVMASLEDIEAERERLLLALGAGVLVALTVATLGGWVVGRQSLRPLTILATQASSITERDPNARLQAPNPGDELGRFARAFNELLDRLAAALHGQRQFMADASHEMRTPVSVVRTTAQVTLARSLRSEEDYRESLTIVEEQSARLARLVDAMFLLSRAEAAGIRLMPEPLYLDDLVGDCARALRVLAKAQGVDVLTCGDTEVSWTGDNGLLRQMVSNLLENAIRYSRGVVTVTVTRATNGGATIRVADDGDGIPVADQTRIFDRFVRLNARSSGAGLGLPIARWVAEAHGGTLVLESSGPTGSCFTVTLPA